MPPAKDETTEDQVEDKTEDEEEEDPYAGMNLSDEEKAALEEEEDEGEETEEEEDHTEDEDETDDEALAAKGETEEEETEEEPVKKTAPAFEPVYQSTDDPEEITKQIASVDELRGELGKLLDEGDITVTEYHNRLSELSDKKTELVIAKSKIEQTAEFNAQTREERWKWEIERFLHDNEEFSSSIHLGAMKACIADLQADKENAGKPMNWYLETAREKVLEAFGLDKKSDKNSDTDDVDNSEETQETSASQGDKKGDKKKDKKPDKKGPYADVKAKKAAPAKTLHDVPSAGTGVEESGDEFTHLDNLEGLALEHALAKLTPEKMERYADTRNLHQ